MAKIHVAVLNMILGETHLYLSSDSMDDEDDVNIILIRFLYTLEVGGWPPHKLMLKVGTPVMLLCNLDASYDLYNGAILIVSWCLA